MSDTPEFIQQTEIYESKGHRPFRLVILPWGADHAVAKWFTDGKEPEKEKILEHHLAGCVRCFDLRKNSFDINHGIIAPAAKPEEEASEWTRQENG